MVRGDETSGDDAEAAYLKWLMKLFAGEISHAPLQFMPPSSMDDDYLPCDDRGTNPGLLQEISPKEMRRRVEECVNKLPAELRELIVLHDYAGKSWEEIASITKGRSADAVRVKHARALIELGKLLRDSDE